MGASKILAGDRFQKVAAVYRQDARQLGNFAPSSVAPLHLQSTLVVLPQDGQNAGVDVFFLTNRACERFDGFDGDCPYEQVTIEDLREVGIETDPEHLLMAWEQPGWNKEKLNRREHIAKTHRIIMLFGDDYGDFVHCTRASALAPCTENATRASRHLALDTYDNYWGNGWYILPNPMHGSWTSVR